MRPRVLLRLVMVAGLAGAMSLPATAAAAASQPEPWQPYVQEEWTAPAGRYCSFPLQLRVVSQDIRMRVLQRYPDGTVKREEYAGPLVVDFVNGDTGRSVRRDAGGTAFVEYRQDGSWRRYTIVGPAGFGFRATDPYPQGYYILDGLHVILFDADGTRRMAAAVGAEDNICVAVS